MSWYFSILSFLDESAEAYPTSSMSLYSDKKRPSKMSYLSTPNSGGCSSGKVNGGDKDGNRELHLLRLIETSAINENSAKRFVSLAWHFQLRCSLEWIHHAWWNFQAKDRLLRTSLEKGNLKSYVMAVFDFVVLVGHSRSEMSKERLSWNLDRDKGVNGKLSSTSIRHTTLLKTYCRRQSPWWRRPSLRRI